MASVVGICNLALASIGHRAEVTAISPPDGSQEAALCSRFYEHARDAALEAHEWSFATKRVALADLGTPPTGWDYRYAMPNGVIRPLRVVETGTTTEQPYAIESDDSGTVIYTDVENAEFHYVARITDPTKYSPSFTNALAWTLAAYLAGPLTGDLKLGEYAMQMSRAMVSQSQAADANATKRMTQDAIAARYPIGAPRLSSTTGTTIFDEDA